MITDTVQRNLRERGILTDSEILKKEGDLYYALNVLTQERRIIQNSQVIKEILTSSSRHGQKTILKG